jgi:uncharacterized protein
MIFILFISILSLIISTLSVNGIENFKGGKSEAVADITGSVEDLNELDEHGKTALHHAASYAAFEAVKNLCKTGADSVVTTPDGTTALMMAAEKGFYSTVKEFFQHCGSASVNMVNKRGKSALSSAVVGNFEMVVRLLLENGGDANIALRDEKSLLMAAASPGVIGLLLEYGADANAKDRFGNSALIIMATRGHVESCQYLLRGNAEVNHSNKEGYTALMLAASRGHDEIVRILAEANALIDSKNKYGVTALQIAFEDRRISTIETLVEYGARFVHLGIRVRPEIIEKRKKRAALQSTVEL